VDATVGFHSDIYAALVGCGFALVMRNLAHKDIYMWTESVVVTGMSAIIMIFIRRDEAAETTIRRHFATGSS
jgi:hypothetical protein